MTALLKLIHFISKCYGFSLSGWCHAGGNFWSRKIPFVIINRIRGLNSNASRERQNWNVLIFQWTPYLQSMTLFLFCFVCSVSPLRLPDLRSVIVLDSRQSGMFNFEDLMQAGSSQYVRQLEDLQKKLSCDDPINIQFTSVNVAQLVLPFCLDVLFFPPSGENVPAL